ncbi:hypothetical protein NMG60_11005625 [Bertholletia excelsa]
MTVQKSGGLVPTAIESQSSLQTHKGGTIEPSTPVKTLEPLNLASDDFTPSSASRTDALGLGSGSVSVSGTIRRRSLRLASIHRADDITSCITVPNRKRKNRMKSVDECGSESAEKCGRGVVESETSGLGEQKVRVSDRSITEAPGQLEIDLNENVSEIDVITVERGAGNSVSPSDLGGSTQISGKGRGKRKSVAHLLDLETVILDGEKRFVNLRSGKKIAKRGMDGKSGNTSSLREESCNGNNSSQVNNSGQEGKVSDGVLNGGTGEGDLMDQPKRYLALDDAGTPKVRRESIETLTVNSVDWVDVELNLGGKAGNSGRNSVSETDMLPQYIVTNGLAKDPALNENYNDTEARSLEADEKGKGKVVDNDLSLNVLSAQSPGSTGLKELDKYPTPIVNHSTSGLRLSREAKGKGKIVEDTLLSNCNDEMELELTLAVGDSTKIAASVSNHVVDCVSVQGKNQVLEPDRRARRKDYAEPSRRPRGRDYKERFRDIAKQNASRFAHFSSQEVGENRATNDAEREMPRWEENNEMEDWPGPFSTAMKIIKDREINGSIQQPSSCLDSNKPAPIIWIPKKNELPGRSKVLIPSLHNLCMGVLAKNADAIVSLDGVPDVLKHELSQLLCDSRRMDSHFLDLLVRGSPTEIRIRDCSWLTEEQFTSSFESCETNRLVVLQLDQCGRCMPDYVLNTTLAHLPNCLPVLTTISLKGACRLSDVGLSALVASAPALRSINLSQCSLLTSNGINSLADSLASVLRELYIDDCQNIDAMYILPALSKLEHLEVLSLTGIQTVCDDFVCKFVAARGHNIKELVLTNCTKLTDSSLKSISETCTGLRMLDLGNLWRLTDCAMRYLANGCQTIETLKLCRNPFSDEAVAAYLETSGESLKDLSLNNVKKVSHNTAISLSTRAKNLFSLDLSWCRNLTNEAVGLIVDSCLSLRVLKLFGCTQITDVFLNGHSNPDVKIIGLKMTPLLEHLKVPDLLKGPLQYSSVPSSF